MKLLKLGWKLLFQIRSIKIIKVITQFLMVKQVLILGIEVYQEKMAMIDFLRGILGTKRKFLLGQELKKLNNAMKITLCGSIKFIEEMSEMKKHLEKQNHEIFIPTSAETGQTKDWWDKLRVENPDEFIKIKADRVRGHFQKIVDSDAILVLNYEKNGVKNYIGGNTLMEMGLAFYFGKKIYLLNPIPQKISYEEEIFGMNPIIVQGDIAQIV